MEVRVKKASKKEHSRLKGHKIKGPEVRKNLACLRYWQCIHTRKAGFNSL